MSEGKRAARIGPYELLRRIGKGGMASVYLARQGGEAGFSRTLAVKVMHPHLTRQKELVDMLMDEARLAARLTHPHVVSTVDLGQDGGRYYLAMEYVEGVALDRLLRTYGGERPPEVLVTIAIDALLGLAAAHALTDASGAPLELVHRDVTPGNVIVGLDGRARILDFGVAKARARLTKTMPGIVKGKAGYVAPEVALGRPIDGRADVFSMGVLLWNALTGEALYDTDDLAQSIRQLVSTEAPPPSQRGLRPPPIFDQPILTALQKQPSLRHASATAMAEALTDALAMYSGAPDHLAVGDWVTRAFGPMIEERRRLVAPEIEEERADPTRDIKARRSSASESGIDDSAPTEVVDPSAMLEDFARDAARSGSWQDATPSLSDGPTEWGEEEPASLLRTVLIGFFSGLLVLALGVGALVGWRAYQTRSAGPPPFMSATELDDEAQAEASGDEADAPAAATTDGGGATDAAPEGDGGARAEPARE